MFKGVIEMKETKIKPKTRKQIETEIDSIITGKDRSQRGKMLNKAYKTLCVIKPAKQVRQEFIDEYVKKYGEISSGKKTIEELKQESMDDIKKAKTTGI